MAYEGISSFLQHKRNNALLKAINAMNNKANIQHNKLMKLDDIMLMYGIYNADILEKLIKTVHEIHNTTLSHEKLFAGKQNCSVFRILYAHSLGLQHYSTNSLLYLRIIQNKYISLYKELITQLCTYVSAIRILAKGYLPNTLMKPAKLQEILSEVKKLLQITDPDYNLVLDRLHLYYDMQLVTFGSDKDMNLVIQFQSVYTASHSETLDSISTGDSSSFNFRSEHQGSIIHALANQKALHCLKFRDIHLFETAGIKIMQKYWL